MIASLSRIGNIQEAGPHSPGQSPATVLLIRHAVTDAVGVWLAGRTRVPLSAAGRAQAARLARAIAGRVHLDAIYTSPLIRARATARALGRPQRVDVQTCDDLLEIDFGRWTGMAFAALESDPAWQRFNRARGTATIPGGEQPRDAQHRMVSAIARLAARHAGATIALVSHAEPIRLGLLHYRSMPLDRYAELDVAPASVSAVSVSDGPVQILYVNDTALAGPTRLR